MRPKILIVVCGVALAAAIVGFILADNSLEKAKLKLPDGRIFTYAGITRGTPTRIPNPEFPTFFAHQLYEQPSLFWRLVQKMPPAVQTRLNPPKAKYLGSEDFAVDQALWFTGPAAEHDERYIVYITDDRGYEVEVEWAELKKSLLSMPAVAPRRGKYLRIGIRKPSSFQLGGALEPPLATATIRNRLVPAGPPLVELDPLPATKKVGAFEVTLKRVLQRKGVSSYTGGLEMEWEVSKDGKRCPDWQLDGSPAGYFSDGSGNGCLAHVVSGGSPAIFGCALFSDDPVWHIKLRFRRRDENRSDYDPVIRINDLPVPNIGQKTDLNRTIEAPPWRIVLTDIEACYSAAHIKNMIVLNATVTPAVEGVIPRVLRSEPLCFSEEMTEGIAQWYFNMPTDPNLKTWSMDLGMDGPLVVEFQSKVEFAP